MGFIEIIRGVGTGQCKFVPAAAGFDNRDLDGETALAVGAVLQHAGTLIKYAFTTPLFVTQGQHHPHIGRRQHLPRLGQ